MEKNNEKTIDMIKFEVPFFQAPNGIFDLNLDIKTNTKLVYLYLCRCGNNGADAFPSYNKIAEVCGIGRRTAIDCVQELVDVNLLYKEGRKNEKGEATSNLYIVNMPENATCDRLTKDKIKAKKKTRKKGGATDALLKKENLGGATDALGGATDALGGAGVAPYKELLINKPNINNYNTSSSSKGKNLSSLHPLVELFNDSICELKKTTTVKFMKYVEKYDKEFIEAVITYCEERNAKSYSYFEKTIEKYISEGITSVEDMNKSIENFKGENKAKKNRAIKEKEEVKKEEAFEDAINDRMLDDLAGDIEIDDEVVLTGEDVGEKVKGLIKNMISEVSFNTWIKNLEIRLDNNTVVAGCPNNFTREIVEQRYSDMLYKSIELNGLGNKLKFVVVAK